jgi:hypothetical protein
LVTEGGVDRAGVFHEIPRIDESRLEEIFSREVPAILVHKDLLSPEWAERILFWPHSGFSVHSLVRAKIRPEAERGAHRGKVRKASPTIMPLRIVEEELLWETDPPAEYVP